MAREVVMPALEMAQDVGTLVRWLKSDGDLVKKGEPIMEIETDKAVVEIEAADSGILSNITAKPGDEIPVGRVIALLRTEEEVRSQSARDLGIAGSLSASGQEPSLPALSAGIESSPPLRQDRPPKFETYLPRLSPATPKVRRLASEHGISLAGLAGSGPNGAVVVADLAARLMRQELAPRPEDNYRVIPVKGKRKIIAERLQRSFQEAPHIALTRSIDMGNVKQLVELLNRTVDPAAHAHLKVTAVLAKAVATSLSRFPRLNAHLVDREIREYRTVHLGIAVSLEDGLVVPVIRNADRKGLAAIQFELQGLTMRARNGSLRGDEMKGSTFTISNLGMFGIEQFSAILNPPEVGILSVGVIKDLPVGFDGQIALRPMMQATINVDHLVVDGAEAAGFLKSLKETLETPDALGG